jgi:hypothetical protein
MGHTNGKMNGHHLIYGKMVIKPRKKYGVHGICSWFVLKADLLLAEIIRNKNISENDLEMGRS